MKRDHAAARRRITFAGLAVVCLGSFALVGAIESKDDADSLMRQKLTQAQTIVEGLALEDYDKIRSGADELLLISQTAQWTARQSPKYNELGAEFRTAAARLAQMAETRNLDGATLGFMQITMSCVECHKLVRGHDKLAAE